MNCDLLHEQITYYRARAFEAFLQKVSRAARRGGSVIIVDQDAPTAEDQQMIQEGEEGKVYAWTSASSIARYVDTDY